MAKSQASVGSGVGLLLEAIRAVLTHPVRALALVAGLVIIPVVAPLWGGVLTWAGWLEARRKLPDDGLVALGRVLAPERSRGLFADGVWRGLWRAHGTSLAFACVELPAALLVLLPALAVRQLCTMTAAGLKNATAATIVGMGVPALVGLACAAVIVGHFLLMWRLIGKHSGHYVLGLLFAFAGACWPVVLGDALTLVVLGFALAAVGLAGGAVIWGAGWLAGVVGLQAFGGALTLWLGAAVGLFVVAVFLEALGRWAEGQTLEAVSPKSPWSFSAWLSDWLGAVFGWFARQGMIAVGAGASLAIGLFVALLAIRHGEVFTSWVAVAWFAVSAAVLIALRVTASRSKA